MTTKKRRKALPKQDLYCHEDYDCRKDSSKIYVKGKTHGWRIFDFRSSRKSAENTRRSLLDSFPQLEPKNLKVINTKRGYGVFQRSPQRQFNTPNSKLRKID